MKILPTPPTPASFPSSNPLSNVCSTVSDLLQPAPSTISKGIIPRHYCVFIIPSRSFFFSWKTFFPVSGQNFFSPLSVDVFPVLNIRLFFRLVDKNNFYAIHVPVNVVGVFMFLRLNIFYIFFRWINFMCTH